MNKVAEELEQFWRSRLLKDEPEQVQRERDEIINWLLGEDSAKLEELTPDRLAIAQQGMDYRYRILRQRYLGANPTKAYRNLINRLGSIVMLRNKIRTWVALSRDRQRAVNDVLQEVIQEMLNSDRYIQAQITWISQCTKNETLRNSLLLTSLEEYCLRPIRNQPLLVYRFVNYLRRTQRGGMTQVPQTEIIRLISEEVNLEESDSAVSLLDSRAIAEYQAGQTSQDKQGLRLRVQREFETHLAEKVGSEAVEWLRLYLQGRSQEAIAQSLNLPIKQVYRLREKIGYHAVRVFAMKGNPELVANWLEITPKEHNLGLTPKQWEIFWQGLTPTQRQIVEQMKVGKSLDAIAQALNWKKSQLMGEWSQLYLVAQELRSEGTGG
ncbi:HetZ-related protein 2 [Candidatus Gracilibacteria bacterium]|nr:HetZ-related protein 2 [Candidatus Gracilibacteria bacterium]NJP21319.1 HetZ-related protein 2 [Hydrococcus sp. CRU_1_1]